MSAALRQTVAYIHDARQPPAPRRGRPRGSFGPLAMWLNPQIQRFKKQGEGCRNTFRALSLVEGGDDDSFTVSAETGESWMYDIGANIAGHVVTYESFRKAWQRTKIF